MQNITDPTHNNADRRPRFTFEIQDHLTGVVIDSVCGFYDLWPGDGITVWTTQGSWVWKDWSTIGLDLQTLVPALVPGQLLDLVFTVHGCAFTAHTGYAYISVFCGSMNIQVAGCEGSGEVTLTGPPGFVTYKWQGPYCPTCPPDPPVYFGNPVTLTTAQGAITGNVFHLTLTALNGCEVENILQTIAFTNIIAEFSHGSACMGQGMQFTDQSTISQNQITGWDWDFGDLSPVVHTQNPIHTYAAANTYTVTLIAHSSDNCTDTIAHQVTVDPLPSPTFLSGDSSVCLNIPNHVYATQAGKSNYIWTIPPQATVTAGGAPGDNSVTLTWTATGSYSIGVNYTEPASGCTGASPASFPVVVNALPVPTFTSGDSPVCLNNPNHVYTTQAGKSNYIWTIPPQATVTAGGTVNDNSVTLTWNTTGNFSIGINYTEPATGCTAVSLSFYAVVVNALPVPTFISGDTPVCLNVPNNVYTTQAGKSNYTWTIPPEATVTAGGTVNDNSVTLTWNTVGNFAISVNYTEPATGCTAAGPTSYPVLVNALPVPTFTFGVSPVCLNIPNNVYRTQAGNSNYIWTIPPQATVNAGGTVNDNSVTLTWNTAGNFSVSVNYTEPATGCTAAGPVSFPVLVNALPVPTFTSGASPVCLNVPNNVYTTQAGKSNYIWTIPPQATVTAGGTVNDNSVTLTWNTVGNFSIGVNYTEPTTSCTAAVPAAYNVTVNPLPVTTITAGPGPDCELHQHVYQTPVNPACTFTWSANPGNVVSGQGTNIATINWLLPGPGTVFVTGTLTSTTGCTSSSTFQTTVYPSPVVSFTACFDQVTTKNAKSFILQGGIPLGGQYQGSPGISYDAGTGKYWFNPASPLVFPGVHQITYLSQNSYGCSNTTPPVPITVLASNAGFPCGTVFTDPRDNHPYPTVQIGTAPVQCWMTQNLDYGQAIASSLVQRDNCIPEKYCYGDIPANCVTEGGMYQWDELMRYNATLAGQGFCPPGWHVPTENDWNILFAVYISSGFAGSPLKYTGYSGFNALLSGMHFNDVIFKYRNWAVMLWSSSLHGTEKAWAHGMNDPDPSVSFYPSYRNNAFGVRCIKD